MWLLSASANLPPHPCLQTSHPSFAHFVAPLSAPYLFSCASGYSSIPYAFSSSPDPLRGMWKTMKPQTPENFPKSAKAAERQRALNEREAQRVSSWTMQNEMNGVLNRMTTGAA